MVKLLIMAAPPKLHNPRTRVLLATKTGSGAATVCRQKPARDAAKARLDIRRQGILSAKSPPPDKYLNASSIQPPAGNELRATPVY